jgi:hypothetical protein
MKELPIRQSQRSDNELPRLTQPSMERADPIEVEPPVDELYCKTAASRTHKRPCANSKLPLENDSPMQIYNRADNELPRTTESFAEKFETDPK